MRQISMKAPYVKPHTLSVEEKENIIGIIREFLSKKPEIIAGLLFGSFPEGSFRDIDIGLVLDASYKPLRYYEQRLEREILNLIHFPVDIRILNIAPVRFVYPVLKKQNLLFCTNLKEFAQFESGVLCRYFDYAYYVTSTGGKSLVLSDREVVSTLFSELYAAMEALDDIVSGGKDLFFTNRHMRGSAKYHLLVAIESMTDITTHLITRNSWRLPEDYGDTFQVMAENRIITREEAGHLADMARFRNRLVHQYWKIDDELIWDILVQDRADIMNYSEKIVTVIRDSKKPETRKKD